MCQKGVIWASEYSPGASNLGVQGGARAPPWIRYWQGTHLGASHHLEVIGNKDTLNTFAGTILLVVR